MFHYMTEAPTTSNQLEQPPLYPFVLLELICAARMLCSLLLISLPNALLRSFICKSLGWNTHTKASREGIKSRKMENVKEKLVGKVFFHFLAFGFERLKNSNCLLLRKGICLAYECESFCHLKVPGPIQVEYRTGFSPHNPKYASWWCFCLLTTREWTVKCFMGLLLLLLLLLLLGLYFYSSYCYFDLSIPYQI